MAAAAAAVGAAVPTAAVQRTEFDCTDIFTVAQPSSNIVEVFGMVGITMFHAHYSCGK